MTHTSTVVGGWAVAVSRALNALGCDGDQLLEDAGVDLSRKFVHDARFSSAHTRKFWALALTETGLDDIGLQVANFVCPTTFHALGFSLWASGSLYDALVRMERFDVLLNDGCELNLLEERGEEGEHYRFIMQVKEGDTQPLVCAEGVDYFLGAVTKLLRDMKSPDFAPVSVNLMRREPASPEPWLQHFQCPVNFAAADNSLVFRTGDLQELLPTGNPQLAVENDKLVAEYLTRHEFQDIAMQVEAKLLELMPCGVNKMEEVAEALQLSPRTLQYRLTQKQTSFKEVLDRTRQRLAKRYLQYSRKTFSEIAYSLAFSDPSHFNRAFKRWTGQTPTRYRAEQARPE